MQKRKKNTTKAIKMDKLIISKLRKTFEDYVNKKEGIEFWFARDLQKLLNYDEWRNFQKVSEKAKVACKNSDQEITDHFVDINKMVCDGMFRILTRPFCLINDQDKISPFVMPQELLQISSTSISGYQ